jgi:hypothetical protein
VTRAILLSFVVAVPVVAAPPPKDSATTKILRLFGEVIDPDKDCTISLDGERLRMSIPGTTHGIHFDGSNNNAPRVLQDVTGDFVVKVKVVKTALPADYGPEGLAGAGLIVTDADQAATFQRFHTIASTSGGGSNRVECYRFSSSFTDPPSAMKAGVFSMGGHLPSGAADKPVYLKVTRTGSTVSTATSADGTAWVSDSKHTLKLSRTVRVGVFANHSGKKPYEAEFESFTVSTPSQK